MPVAFETSLSGPTLLFCDACNRALGGMTAKIDTSASRCTNVRLLLPTGRWEKQQSGKFGNI